MQATDPQELSVEEVTQRLEARFEQSDEEQEEAPAEPTEPDLEEDETLEASEEEAEEGDEADAEEEDDAEDEQGPPDTFTVMVDGEEREVSLDELKRGFSGQAYVQYGMEKNAARAKELEDRDQQSQEVIAVLSQMYQQAQATGFLPAPQPPDPAMEAEDPIGYSLDWARFNREQMQWGHQQAQMRQLANYQAQIAKDQHEAHLAEQRDVLAQKFPETKTEEGKKAFEQRLLGGAQKFYGLSKEVLAGVSDAFAAEILNDAIAFRELKEGKPATRKKLEGARPKMSPKGGRSSKLSKAKTMDAARRNVKRSGGSPDAIAALLDAKG